MEEEAICPTGSGVSAGERTAPVGRLATSRVPGLISLSELWGCDAGYEPMDNDE